MCRRVFVAASVVSLLLFMAASASWVRSYWVAPSVTADRRPEGYLREWWLNLLSDRGWVSITAGRDKHGQAESLYVKALRAPSHVGGLKPIEGKMTVRVQNAEPHWGNWYLHYDSRPAGAWALLTNTVRFSFCGFGWEQFDNEFCSSNTIFFPHALPCLLTGVLPTIWIGSTIIRRRKRQRQLAGACAACGYDLTGNTSGVCPECGTATPGRLPGKPASLHAPPPSQCRRRTVAATLRLLRVCAAC